MADYVERKATASPREDITRRMADIALEILPLQSEKNRFENILLTER